MKKNSRPKSLKGLKWFLLFLPLGMGQISAQDIHFSQLTESPLLLNPGATGMFEGTFRASLDYKSQWASMSNPYKTMIASFDMSLLKEKKKLAYLGLGGYFYSDKAGDAQLGTTSANVSVSAIVPISSESKLSTGFNFGYNQRSANINALQFPNQYNGQTYDAGIASNETNLFNSFSFFDLSTGVHYQFLKSSGGVAEGKDVFKISAGIAYFHITQPNQNFSSFASDPLYGKIVFNALMRYDIPQTRVGVVPMIVYMSQGPYNELDLGASVRYKISEGTKVTGFKTEAAISAGMLYRLNDAVIPRLLLEFANFGIGFSYDVTTSSLSQAAHKGGGVEISLTYSNLKDAVFQEKK